MSYHFLSHIKLPSNLMSEMLVVQQNKQAIDETQIDKVCKSD